jgi:hypothetical protein
MTDDFLKFKSDPRVLNDLRAAAARRATPDEIAAQRVSYVYSAMSEKGQASRAQVAELVGAYESGRTAVHS